MVRHKDEWTGHHRPISTVIDGVTYEGYYQIDADIIRVSYKDDYETSQWGGLAQAPDSIAEILSHELVRRNPSP
jgi:hypothetical protein